MASQIYEKSMIILESLPKSNETLVNSVHLLDALLTLLVRYHLKRVAMGGTPTVLRLVWLRTGYLLNEK